MSCKEGRKAENVRKNRYRNVLPYDHTIIKLNIEPSSDPEVNDYINASLIEVKSDGVMYSEFEGLNKRYISTQGCMQNTVDSFWQMIYQENVRIIVMTTKELERGRLKCYKYWPDYKADALKTGIKNDISIRTIKEEHRGEYIVRKFELSNMSDASSTYEIYHYQFVSWEDQQSCPSNSLLAYLDDINECLQTKCSPNCGPMVVHCSAGIGRTGTLIVIDILLSRIKMFGK
jgi:tyrosine-protein phosphatase non-receptor type 11